MKLVLNWAKQETQMKFQEHLMESTIIFASIYSAEMKKEFISSHEFYQPLNTGISICIVMSTQRILEKSE